MAVIASLKAYNMQRMGLKYLGGTELTCIKRAK